MIAHTGPRTARLTHTLHPAGAMPPRLAHLSAITGVKKALGGLGSKISRRSVSAGTLVPQSRWCPRREPPRCCRRRFAWRASLRPSLLSKRGVVRASLAQGPHLEGEDRVVYSGAYELEGGVGAAPRPGLPLRGKRGLVWEGGVPALARGTWVLVASTGAVVAAWHAYTAASVMSLAASLADGALVLWVAAPTAAALVAALAEGLAHTRLRRMGAQLRRPLAPEGAKVPKDRERRRNTADANRAEHVRFGSAKATAYAASEVRCQLSSIAAVGWRRRGTLMALAMTLGVEAVSRGAVAAALPAALSGICAALIVRGVAAIAADVAATRREPAALRREMLARQQEHFAGLHKVGRCKLTLA